MWYTSIENHGSLGTIAHGINAIFHLGNHAARDHAAADAFLDIGNSQFGNQLSVPVEDAGNIS